MNISKEMTEKRSGFSFLIKRTQAYERPTRNWVIRDVELRPPPEASDNSGGPL